ncbi:MAG: MBOAT family protein [Nannocystaceae bacterium]|nr:MBOAT family protein [Nannocystaceae bacterium]
MFCAVRTGQRAQEWFDLTSIAAPLGFGYYILRLVHYRAEATRGNLRPHGLVQLYAYLAFFPMLIIGPIHRADTFFRWHARRKFAAADLSVAFQRLLYGYVKVVVLARWLVVQQALYVDTLPVPALEVLFASLQYGLFLYFSFAGYSDIAIGLARAMGYRIEENFDSPFLRRNLAEFWRAWHMSLSDWCRRYVFLPVFARTRNHVIALYATMLTLGLWHEFTVRYVLWGAWHAGGLALYRWLDAHIVPRLPVVDSRIGRTVVHGLAIATTFTFVVLGFTITRTENPAAAADAFWVIFTGWSVAE